MNLFKVLRLHSLPMLRGKYLNSVVSSISRCLSLNNAPIPSGSLVSEEHRFSLKVCILSSLHTAPGNSFNFVLDKSRYLRCSNLPTSAGSS
ncbi:hypothetical protein ACHQM5_014438 [Ranunculus cassubicifolius]